MRAVERRILRVPAEGLPHQPDRFLHAAAEDLSLRFRHGRRQRQNDGAQTARRGGVRHAAALGDAVDLHQRLRQQLGEHQRHHRAAAVMGGEHRQPLRRRQGDSGTPSSLMRVVNGAAAAIGSCRSLKRQPGA